MQIQVNGRHMDVGEALNSFTNERLLSGVEKYAENPVDAVVTYSKDRFEYLCDVTVHLSTGMRAQARGRADEVYAAFDNALDRMETQLRRYKRRLKDHHKERKAPIEAFQEPTYVIEAAQNESESQEPENLTPVIVAETETKVQTMSVGEAVMQMELADENMLVFRNSSHGGVNVVHRRADGNIGWIDPRRG